MNKSDSALKRSFNSKPDNTPDNNDRIEIGPSQLAFDEWAALDLQPPDMVALREYRLERVKQQLRQRDYAGVLLFDPINIRYATDSVNMQVWTTHNQARCCFIATDGAVVIFDFHNCQHISQHLPLVDEVRNMTSFFYFLGGERCAEFAAKFATEIDALLRQHGAGSRCLAVDKLEIGGVRAFDGMGIEIMDGMELMEIARTIKNHNEMRAMQCAIAACEATLVEFENAMRPGISENELWAYLHFGNIKRGGEWIETRILSSGPRTNPWMAECGPRIIEDGDMIALDTDLIGVYGYCVDLSRTWLVGERTATAAQKQLYQVAYEHIMEDMELLKPGLTFKELTFGGNQLDQKYRQLQYGVKYHGVGLCDEYPAIMYPEEWESGYDGVLQAGMTLCVEAYIGEVGGKEGVKLENQVLITETGYQLLTLFPYDKKLL